jgi:hypothetical protein
MKKKLFAIIALFLFAITLFLLLFPQKKIKYYYDFPFRKVSDANRIYIEDLYTRYADDVSRILVAEDSRSNHAMRIVFNSSIALSINTQYEILSDMLTYMYAAGVWKPHEWEVFFCQGKQPYSAYVSQYGDDNVIGDKDDEFSDWYAVPDVENILSFHSLKLMMKRTNIPMYSLGHPENKTPIIPVE